ncbi:hypothetical protein [Rubrobacter tropicus]|uniref:hypothetical protein n=1 Tax=Rubrobacter tropicus TaxID=2653851 RepID=UPI0014097F4E|nr:hypothetical protein [Rubrobacter tropicus]
MPRDMSGPSDELDRLRAILSERRLSGGFVKNNVELDRFEAGLFRDVLDAEPELRALVDRAGEDAPTTFAALVLDLFVSFYKMVPALVAEGAVDPPHLRANRPFIERLREDEETLIARLSTARDEVASALATIEAARRFLRELLRRPALRDWMDHQAEPRPDDPATPTAPPDAGLPDDRAGEEPREEPAEVDEAPGRDDPPAPDAGEGAVPPQLEPEQFSDDPPAVDVQDDFPDNFAGDLRAIIRAASTAGSAEAAAHAAALRAWGLKPADLRTVPVSERLELARKLRTKRMRDLADLLGRMRNHRRASERRKVKANRDEVYDVETSGDIARSLPSERAGAFGSGNPLRRLDFYRRLSQRKVLSYARRTEEPVGRGPVIAMIDSSWSMTGAPMEWASAIALALAHAAAGGGSPGTGARRVHAVFFNARIVLDVELAPGEKDVRKFLAVGTVDAAGGTKYEPPISRARDLISESPNTPEGTPDLLLVTDGICRLPEDDTEELREHKRSRGFKLVAVLVGDDARAGSVEPFSDKVIRAQDLSRASGARDAAGALFDSL